MRSDEEIIRCFKELGIMGNAAKAYLTLLRIGPASATKISQYSGVPQPRTYDIMNYLQKRGFVEVQKIGNRNIYKACEPEFALNRLMGHLRSQEVFLREYLKNVKSETETLPLEIWLVKGKSNILARIIEIIEKSRTELLLAIMPEFLTRSVLSSLYEAARRGVVISLMLYSDRKGLRKKLEKIKNCGSVRRTSFFYYTIVMADYQCALLLSHVETKLREVEYGIYTSDLGLLHMLEQYFYIFIWLSSEVITEAPITARKFVHVWKAIEILDILLNKGKTVRAKVIGKEVKTSRKIQVEGIVSGTTMLPPNKDQKGIYSIILKTDDGKTITVGGRGAFVEDVEAASIELEVLD